MSKQIHDEGRREQSRRTQVKFRADKELVDAFDDYVDSSEHDSRAQALRSAMRQAMGAAEPDRAPLQPPADERLRTTYLALVDIANADGEITHELAVEELKQQLGAQDRMVNRRLKALSQDGYLLRLTSVYGGDAWRLAGQEDS
ncbi:hypothetical protein [Salinirussus salinus]|uniref:hypothetical protein n=1 Tax=Salinirussus salinus TaxID=1198300 RepID=UPI00135AAD85|nr:hypothetical protein [Salinirussus salinus]